MFKYACITFLSLIILFFLIRLVLPRELDDLHPDIPCQESLIKKSDILWVIPLYNNNSVANNAAWCESLKMYNKALQLHGVYHTYQEFDTERDQGYLEEGIQAFTQCFNLTPTEFKAPNLAYSSANNKALQQAKLERKGKLNQIFHKVYHCNDTGRFSNTFINWF